MQSVFAKYLIWLISIHTVIGDSSSSGCSLDTWQCNNGQCIQSDDLCDGKYDCVDKSDETIEVCLQIPCPIYVFQCAYGACVSGSSMCNGNVECVDSSDEARLLCAPEMNHEKEMQGSTHSDDKSISTPTLQSSEVCVIPDLPQIEHLVIRKHPLNETINVGTIVGNLETIHIECKNSTDANDNRDLICINGLFDRNFPSCTCDGSFLRRLSLRISCPDEKACTDEVPIGTTVEVRCAYGYNRIPNEVQYLKCLENGSYDKTPLSCKHQCGKLAHNSVALSKDGIPTDPSYSPWHVAVVEQATVKYQYICGGAIVSPSIIISSAHCYWDAQIFLLRTIDYHIIAGRNTHNYTTEQNEYAQIVKVKQVQIPLNYEGKQAAEKGDIAFLKLETPLKYSPTIAPICLLDNLQVPQSSYEYIESNRKGFVSVFNSQNQLEVLEMITLSYHDCREKFPEGALTDDKFCIYNSDNKTIGRGNSGAPFFVKTITADGIEGEPTYNFIGVISHMVPSETREQIIAITNIFYADTKFKLRLEGEMKYDKRLF